MSFSEEFVPGESESGEEAGGGITIAGTTVSPWVLGGVALVLGLGAAAYLFFTQVKPAFETNQALKDELGGLQAQIDQVRSGLSRIGEAEQAKSDAQRRKDELLAFFATSEVLDTLLIDFERLIIQQDGVELQRFQLNGEAEVINDDSLGELANNRFKRQALVLEVEANFSKVQTLLRTLERFEPIVQVTNLSVERQDDTIGAVELNPAGEVILTPGDILLKTRLQMQVIAARSQAELDAVAAAEAAAAEAAAAEGG
jgi:type IV pilus assembly protein PilO